MRHEKNIPELFTDMIDHLSSLFRKEVQLAKTEASEKVQQATSAVLYMVIGGFVLLAAVILILFAVAAFLIAMGFSETVSFLIVGGATALIGVIALWKGMNDLKASNLKLQRTGKQLRADVNTVKEQV